VLASGGFVFSSVRSNIFLLCVSIMSGSSIIFLYLADGRDGSQGWALLVRRVELILYMRVLMLASAF